MQKNLSLKRWHDCQRAGLPVLMARIMRITIFLTLACVMNSYATGYSQKKLDVSLKEAKLSQVFSMIQKNTHYRFLYNDEDVQNAPLVTVIAEGATVPQILAICFTKDYPLKYLIEDSTVVVLSKSPDLQPIKSNGGSMGIEIPDVVVRGKVTDSSGNPLVGVSVSLKGGSNGTITDASGGYSITLQSGNETLVFTYIGYASKEVSVNGRTEVNVILFSNRQNLNELVVTALGLKQSAISTSYTSQSISGKELNQVKDPNLINALAGKTAGAVITKGSAGPGASSRVIIRGNKSISGNNQPLYVIDGVPMNNANGTQSGDLWGTRDAGDAISNLNPEDIASINVLTGASASALYGSQAANGVILITTKRGKVGISAVSLSTSVSFSNPMVLPELQTDYGQGSGGQLNTAINDSWGPKITNGSDAHLKDFFQTGKTFVNSVAVTNGNDKLQYYLSYANTHATGIVPNDKYNRNNFTMKGTAHVFDDKVTLQGSMMYINQLAQNRPSAGWYFSPIFSLYLFPVGDDFSKYSGKNYEKFDSSRNMYVQNWPYIRNEASSNQNPYWIQYKNQSDEKRNRAILNLTAKWDVNSWLNLTGRATYDRTADDYERRLYASSDPTLVGNNGSYTQNPSTNRQFYADLLLSGNRQLGENMSLTATLGTSVTDNLYHAINLSTDGASTTLYYPNYFSAYALQGAFVHTENLQESLSQAIFGTATIGYKSTFFVNITGRNEWSSTVDQAFFYPSVGISYVLTNTTGTSNVFSFVKLRASYAEVGNALPFGVASFAPNYTLAPNGNINGRTALPFFNGTDTANLKPERSRSFEFGTDMRLFDNNLNVSVTYYHATTFDQVFQIAAPAGSGSTNFWINGGTILNKGFEGLVSYDASFGNLKWEPGITFSKNVNQIRKLSDLLQADHYVLNDAFRIANLYLCRPGSPSLHGAKKYGSYGDLFGRTYQRDAKGNIEYGDDGLPLLSAQNDQYLGNANPDFLLGFTNSFSYKNFSLSFLIDSRFGGQVASSTEQWLDFKGLSKRTGEARDAGGVMLNGKKIDPETYYQFLSGKADVSAATEAYIYDATNIRLRTLAIGYTFPQFSKIFKEMDISLTGSNLFFFYKKAPFDPEVSITTNNSMQGIDGFELPSTRSYSITLNVTF